MTKRAPLATVYCRRCNSLHAEGEHLAKPKVVDKTVVDAPRSKPFKFKKALPAGPDLGEKMNAAVDQVIEQVATNIMEQPMNALGGEIVITDKKVAKKFKGAIKREAKRIKKELETPVFADPPKKRTKAAAQAAVAAEEARKRELRNARQKRWRKKTKKKAKKK